MAEPPPLDVGRGVYPGLSGRFSLDTATFERLRSLIYSAAGISLAPSKRVLLESRLAKRLRALELESFADYCAYLDAHPERELIPFINCITTNKTDFFREQHHFEFLQNHVLPAVEARSRRTGQRRLRIWSAGCSTGEEPYTIAMTVCDWLKGRPGWDARILASDIDTNVLRATADGVYTDDRLTGVPDEWRHRWFVPAPETGVTTAWRASAALRELITVRRINLNETPWPINTTFDVIFCRNVIIYFDRATQSTLLSRFARLLAPDGHLIIGHSETLAWLSDTFAQVRGAPTVYRLASTTSAKARSELGRPTKDGAARSGPIARGAVSAAQGPLGGGESGSGSLGAAMGGAPAASRYLAIGDVHASRDAEPMRTVLGTCVVAALFDAQVGVGGANHFLMPAESRDEPSTRYAEPAMAALVRALVAQGADRGRLRAKLFGGAAVIAGARGEELASRNIDAARTFLAREAIPIVGERLGGHSPLEIVFYPNTGRALVREVPIDAWRAHAADEAAALTNAADGRAASASTGAALERIGRDDARGGVERHVTTDGRPAVESRPVVNTNEGGAVPSGGTV